MLDELGSKKQESYANDFSTKYSCKEMCTRIYFDQELCLKMINSVNSYLTNNSPKSVNLTQFSFDQNNKIFYISFETKLKKIDWTNYINTMIYGAFKEFYKSLVFNENDYYKLFCMDCGNAPVFKLAVKEDIDSICNPAFSCFTILYLNITENNITIQINLI